ncbi:MAG: hypothetical protein AAGH79_15515 [Bacteroidota bacterium]
MDLALHILVWGGFLTLGSFVILMGSWVVDPKIWAADLGAPKEMQNYTAGIITVILLFAIQLPIMAFSIKEYQLMAPHISFWFGSLIAYLVFQVFNLADLFIFNLADLFIFDWLIYMKLKPKFMVPDYLPTAFDFSKHAKDSLNGLVIGIFPALLSAVIWYFLL